MDPKEFVETRTKRTMAQVMEEFERTVEHPLSAMVRSDGVTHARINSVVNDLDGFKRIFRKKLQAFADDCLDLMPSDIEINAFEPVVRR